jgi:2-keto-4-pentenoate hydratase
MNLVDFMLTKEEIAGFAKALVAAERNVEPLEPLTARADITIEDAYQIQLEVIRVKKADGEIEVGKKIGLTSKRMQKAFDVDQPDYGHIMNIMMVDEGTPILLSELIQPKIEAEIGFLLDDDLVGPGITALDVLDSTAGVMPTFEVIDSRIKDWKIKIQDSISDNASIGRVVAGGMLTDILGLDLRTIGVVVRKNGDIVETAAGAEVLGNPAQSVAWLANKLSDYGVYLNAGDLIISGSVISPIVIGEGDVIHAEFGGGMGGVVAYFK